MKPKIPCQVFGVDFESLAEFRRASGLMWLRSGDNLEEAVRQHHAYKYRTDAEIAQLLRCSRDKGGYRLVKPVLELIKGGLKYQLECKAIPKDDVYFLAKRLYEAEDFGAALRKLMRKDATRFTGVAGLTKPQRHGLKGDKQRYNRSRVGREY